MITISAKKFKDFTDIFHKSYNQDFYDAIVDDLQIHCLACSCGRKGAFIKHGYYKRSIKVEINKNKIRVLRLKCKACSKTHAILPEWIVPYSQISLEDHVSIINAHLNEAPYTDIMETKPTIDESDINYLLKQFKKHWKERLKAFQIIIDDLISEKCFQAFSRQFMQIKSTPNIHFF